MQIYLWFAYLILCLIVFLVLVFLVGEANCFSVKEEEEKEEEEKAKLKESVGEQRDVALEEMTIPTAREAHEQAKRKFLDKQEQLCELSRALAVLASASVRIRSNFVEILFFWLRNVLNLFIFIVCHFQSVGREREEFLRLVNKEVNLTNLFF